MARSLFDFVSLDVRFFPIYYYLNIIIILISISVVPVTHWDRQVKHLVPVHLDVDDPFLNFKHDLFTIFIDEITTSDIRLYALPRQFTSYDERVSVMNNEDFLKIVQQYIDVDQNRPILYVYNYDDESPKKPPGFI
jgi:hypothetical protein